MKQTINMSPEDAINKLDDCAKATSATRFEHAVLQTAAQVIRNLIEEYKSLLKEREACKELSKEV